MPVALMVADLVNKHPITSSDTGGQGIRVSLEDRGEILFDDLVLTMLGEQGRGDRQRFSDDCFSLNFRTIRVGNDAQQVHER